MARRECLFLPCGGRGGGDDSLGRRAALFGRRCGFAFRAALRGFVEQQIDDFRDTTADNQIDDPFCVFRDSALSHVLHTYYFIFLSCHS